MKRLLTIIGGVLWLMLLVGCGKQQESSKDAFTVYYVSNSQTKIETRAYTLQKETLEEQVQELMVVLGTKPEKLEYMAPLNMGFGLLDYQMQNGKILLNVDANYKKLSVPTEVLVRAAIVRTLTQLPEINFVAITVEGNQLLDSLGGTVGWMSRDQFIENEGNEINTYQEVTLKLFFANEKGDQLVATNRTKEYNTNISLEKLIVEELIKGPGTQGVYPTINPATKVASVTVKDGVCYVNLDESFLTQPYQVTADVTIYSITNSLVELSNVNKVQISINGDTGGTYREKYSFSTYFDRDLDLVINQ